MVSIVDNRPLAISLGANDALTKPLDQAKLLAVLDQALLGAQDDRPILVVADGQGDSAVIVETLERKGYAVELVSGGAQAMDWLARNVPSLIVLDLMLGRVSGFDVLAYARRDARLADAPVIVITGVALTPDEQRFLEERCAELVRRGFAGPEILLEAVQRALVGVEAEAVQ
jgi:CheY-like chemotaxis protein